MVQDLHIRIAYICIGLFAVIIFTLFRTVSFDALEHFDVILSGQQLPFTARTGIRTGTSTSMIVGVWSISAALVVLAARGFKNSLPTVLAILCLLASALAFYGLLGYWYALSS